MSLINLIISRREWFIDLISQHLMLSGISIVLAGIIGLLLGIAIYEKKQLSGIVLAVVNMLYTVPDIAMFGLLIPITGIGNKTAIVAITLYGLLPMVHNTFTGLENVDKSILEAAEGMGSTQRQVLFRISLPLAMPVILSGVRSMVVMTVSIAGIASFIGAGGLGQAIYRGIATNNQNLILAGSIIIAALAIALDYLFGRLEKSKKKKRFIAIMVSFILVVFGCFTIINGSEKSDKTITLGYDNTAEEAILANILIFLIEDNTDINVIEKGDLAGGENVLHKAVMEGEIDLYPEYTGTAWLTILKHEEIPNTEELNERLFEEYNDTLGLSWVGMYGFNDSYGLAVSTEIATKYNIKTYSDLANYSSQLRLGAEPGFYERQDGYKGLNELYHFNFKETADINFSLKYDSLNSGKVDVINVFTTDGELADSYVTLINDDKHYFTSYYCGNVVSNKTLKKYPELKNVCMMTNNLISDEEMSMLNSQVNLQGKEPKIVAKDFLKEKGYL